MKKYEELITTINRADNESSIHLIMNDIEFGFRKSRKNENQKHNTRKLLIIILGQYFLLYFSKHLSELSENKNPHSNFLCESLIRHGIGMIR